MSALQGTCPRPPHKNAGHYEKVAELQPSSRRILQVVDVLEGERGGLTGLLGHLKAGQGPGEGHLGAEDINRLIPPPG